MNRPPYNHRPDDQLRRLAARDRRPPDTLRNLLLRNAITLFVAFLALIWCAHHFGPLCSFLPMILALLGFLTVVVLCTLDYIKASDSNMRSNISGFGGAALALFAGLFAAHVARTIKSSIHTDDVGISVGVTQGDVLRAYAFTPLHGRYDYTPPISRCRVIYSYRVDATSYQRCDYFKRAIFKAGQHVTVMYRLAHPGQARLLKPDESLPDDYVPAAHG